jgi:hypothetical protein
MKQNLEEKIRQRAYELWEQEGRPGGRDRAHWLQAEAEINGPKRPKSRGAAAARAVGRSNEPKRRLGA